MSNPALDLITMFAIIFLGVFKYRYLLSGSFATMNPLLPYCNQRVVSFLGSEMCRVFPLKGNFIVLMDSKFMIFRDARCT